MGEPAQIQAKYATLRPFLDERRRRLWAANEALALGRGGATIVAAATGLARQTSGDGLRERRAAAPPPVDTVVAAGEPGLGEPGPVVAAAAAAGARAPGRQRRAGGGRKPLTHHDPELVHALEALVAPTTRGAPESPLRWTTKSTRKLAATLTGQGQPVSAAPVATLLRQLQYRWPARRKTTEGAAHPDRDAQFKHISTMVSTFQERGQPVVSIDATKQERVGDFKNGGREWPPAGQPEPVRGHDFPDKTLGQVTPYGVFDLTANHGWVSVGTDHDTAACAVDTVHRWWAQMGTPRYAGATDLLRTAAGGGSNRRRGRRWQVALQRLADATGRRGHVCHFPPGTSKWHNIEHGMFSHLTQNWRGRPLVSHAVLVELIGPTTTQTGRRIQAALNPQPYPTGITVSDAELAAVRLEPDAFHGNWNDTIAPRGTIN
ncbi:MAG: ISAzo13 family transposase [Chloroflexi bacterium]|nr:ISAzo13 family transposase [Chloroflexota bacterium]